MVFEDHHAFTDEDIRQIQTAGQDCSAIVCTLKDLVKIKRQQIGNIPIYALAINVEFMSGRNSLFDLIEQTIDPIAQQKQAPNRQGSLPNETVDLDLDSDDANAA